MAWTWPSSAAAASQRLRWHGSSDSTPKAYIAGTSQPAGTGQQFATFEGKAVHGRDIAFLRGLANPRVLRGIHRLSSRCQAVEGRFESRLVRPAPGQRDQRFSLTAPSSEASSPPAARDIQHDARTHPSQHRQKRMRGIHVLESLLSGVDGKSVLCVLLQLRQIRREKYGRSCDTATSMPSQTAKERLQTHKAGVEWVRALGLLATTPSRRSKRHLVAPNQEFP